MRNNDTNGENDVSGGMNMGFGGARQMMSLARDPSNIESLLLQSDDETSDSPAGIFADVINSMRADTARIAQEVGVETDVQRMTPERAAELLSGTVSGSGVEIVEMFNDEARRRREVLDELLDDDELARFEAAKRDAMYSTPAGNDGE